MGHGQPHPLSQAHSCSVDDLENPTLNSAHNEGSTKVAGSKHRSGGQTCVKDGHRYTLVESPSVASSSTGEEEGEFPERGFTQSLPAEIERKISVGSKVRPHPPKDRNRDMDCFSDNFVSHQQNENEIVSASLMSNAKGQHVG